MNQVSFILGAGFSANKGYPMVKDINDALVRLTADDFLIDGSGTVSLKNRAIPEPYAYALNYHKKLFLIEMIGLFRTIDAFDYERFYDFYYQLYRALEYPPFFIDFCDDFRSKHRVKMDNANLLLGLDKSFQQIVALNIIDNENNMFYPPSHACKPYFPGYTGFLYALEAMGAHSIVHIHTLNHDLLFESFNHSDWLQNKLADGFSEFSSPYYGVDAREYKVRLSYYTNDFQNQFRLYKLHGSLDQFAFRGANGQVESYVKIKDGLTPTKIFKEIFVDGKYDYIVDPFNYHPDFLSGTTSKILRYNETGYYRNVFEHFTQNLIASERLVIIGYGCGDDEINRMVSEYYSKRKQPLVVVDPYPSDRVRSFVHANEGVLIEKTPEDICLADFN